MTSSLRKEENFLRIMVRLAAPSPKGKQPGHEVHRSDRHAYSEDYPDRVNINTGPRTTIATNKPQTMHGLTARMRSRTT